MLEDAFLTSISFIKRCMPVMSLTPRVSFPKFRRMPDEQGMGEIGFQLLDADHVTSHIQNTYTVAYKEGTFTQLGTAAHSFGTSDHNRP